MRVLPSALLSALLLAGCGTADPEGATLRVAVVGDGGLAQRLEAEATQPAMIARNNAGQTIAGLATSWRFVDEGRSLILRLQPVKWSDGRELVARDVVTALRRAALRREPALTHAGIENADKIAARRLPASRLGVRAPIARVVEVRLAAISPLALEWLAEPSLAIVRGSVAGPGEPATAAPTLAAYAASGPATLRVLTRRSATAAPDQLPAKITLAATADSGAAIGAFNRGETDIVIGNGLAGLGDARAGVRPDMLRIDQLRGCYGYVAGMSGALADASVRRAIGLAIDRPALAQRFGLSALVPVYGLLPPSLDAPAPPTDLEADRAEARTLLASAGWTAETPLRLTLLLPQGRDHRTVADAVAADLAAIGVTLVISQVVDLPSAVARARHDLALTEASIAAPDAAALLARWRCRPGGHCNSAADVLLDQARLATAAERPALLAEAQALMMAGPPMLSLFTPIRWAIVSRRVEGWTPNQAGSHPLARLQVTRK